MNAVSSIWQQAKALRQNVTTLWRVRRHPDTPWASKILCVAALVYAISPVDLIPDFIPVLGFVDDAVILPLLLALAVRMLPDHLVGDVEAKPVHASPAGHMRAFAKRLFRYR